MSRILPITTALLILTMAALAEAQAPPFVFFPNDLTVTGSAGGGSFFISGGFDSRARNT